MTHLPGRRDDGLHLPDGSHRTTARTADGSDVAVHEAAIAAHLAEHKAVAAGCAAGHHQPQPPAGACAGCGAAPRA